MRRRLLGIRPATSSGWHQPPDAEPSRDGNSTSRVAVSWLTTTQLQGLGFAIDYAAERKRQGDIREIKALLKDGFHPVIFCRFIDTAEYVARHLWEVLRATRVEAVTGRLPRAERETRIQSLVEDGGRFLLVCTDRLSEGINPQQHFDAVLHYDLAWNPTRHEQREGRVDRFGQRAPGPVTAATTACPPASAVTELTNYDFLDALRRLAKSLIAEIGVDMAQFPQPAPSGFMGGNVPGMSPGNNDSAGKRKSGTTAKGNRWFTGYPRRGRTTERQMLQERRGRRGVRLVPSKAPPVTITTRRTWNDRTTTAIGSASASAFSRAGWRDSASTRSSSYC